MEDKKKQIWSHKFPVNFVYKNKRTPLNLARMFSELEFSSPALIYHKKR